MAAVIKGTEASTLIFINSRHNTSHDLKNHYQLKSLPVQLDIFELCQKYIQKPMIFSTALAKEVLRRVCEEKIIPHKAALDMARKLINAAMGRSTTV